MIELGGDIKLDGFEGLEPAKLIVVKKMVGNYAKKIAEKTKFKELVLSLKSKDKKFELEAKLVNKKTKGAKITSDNLFFAMDEVLGKIIKEIS